MPFRSKESAVGSEFGSAPEATEQSAPRVSPAVRESARFYRVRNRVYTGLLVFVVAAGLPVVGIPFLRHRLADRAQVLRQAMAGGFSKPVVEIVGTNQEPFPTEYEHPVARPNYPKLPAYFSMNTSQPYDVGQVYPPRPAKKAKTARAETEPASAVSAAAAEVQTPAQQETVAEDVQPAYRKGKIEEEVYDLLLKSDSNISGLVKGSNSTLQFKSWDVAKREEDLYWVRLVFVRMPEKTEIECIWQVQLMSKQVVPLNFNAKSIPRA
jgi:hypothetical protein